MAPARPRGRLGARLRRDAERALEFLREGLWEFEAEPSTLRARALWLLRFAVVVAEGFVRDRLLLRASALAYFTVISLIPIVAVAVAIAGAIGVRGNFAEIAVEQFAGVLSAEYRSQILQTIRAANFGGLGGLGAVFLFVTTVLGISNVERALNQIWGVQQHRPWSRRFPDYLAVLAIGPLFLGTSLSLGTTLESQWVVQRLLEVPVFATTYDVGLRYVPILVLSLGFAFLNWFIPNTSVRLPAALLAGIFSAVGVVWAQRLFIGLGVGAARADALFGGFAAFPVLIAWIYIFWAIALFGAELAFAYQNVALYAREVRGREPGPAEREAIGLRIALEIGRAFRDGRGALADEALGEDLHVPVRAVRDVLARLERGAVVARRGDADEKGLFQLARPAESIRLADVLGALRGPREAVRGDPTLDATIEALLAELEEGALKGPAGRSLAELLDGIPPLAAPADAGEGKGGGR